MLAALTILLGILSRRKLRQHHKIPNHPNRKDAAYITASAASTVTRGSGWGKKGKKARPVQVGGGC